MTNKQYEILHDELVSIKLRLDRYEKSTNNMINLLTQLSNNKVVISDVDNRISELKKDIQCIKDEEN